MNPTPRDFREIIQELAGTHKRDWINILIATVTAVDYDTFTCTIRPISGISSVDEDYKISGIQLNAEQNDGFILVPSVDSTVVVTYPTKTTPFVSMFSDIDAMLTITAAGQQLLMGKYYDSQSSKIKDCEIQLLASTGEQILIGNPANNSGGGIQIDASGNGSTVKINAGSSKAVLGDKNITALTDVYNMLTAVNTFANSCSGSTDPAVVAAAATLTASLSAMLPTYNSDIQNTTSNNVTLD